MFPAALCYTKIVPVDEVVTLTLFYREDDQLARLMLDETQQSRLNRLWDELHYISQDALTLVDAFAQLMEYATQDADPKVFEPMRKPINDRAAAFRQHLIDTQPKHLDALLDFAGRAYRRPLTEAESQDLRALYGKMRKQEIPHDEAFRLLLARVLVAPAFLYRVEKPGPGAGQGPVSDWELASRLSYFLWSSQPDEELRQVAAAGRLRDPDTLVTEMRRMLRDPKTRRLATEFACQWLHIADFDHLDEKSERHFPTFAGLRGAMYEESIQFFTDLFQNDGSVLDILERGLHVPERAAGEALRHPFETGFSACRSARKRRPTFRLASRRRHQTIRTRRDSRPGDDAGQAIRRIAHQSDPARQLDQRSAARRTLAAPAERRAATSRGRSRDRGPDRPATRRKA